MTLYNFYLSWNMIDYFFATFTLLAALVAVTVVIWGILDDRKYYGTQPRNSTDARKR